MSAPDLPVHLDVAMPEEEITRLYLALIHDPAATRESLVAAGIGAAQVDLGLQILTHRGLAEVDDDGAISIPPPEGALAAYTAEVERQLRRVRASAPQLGLIHRRVRALEDARTNPLRASTLDSLAEIRSASIAVVAGAERSILAMRAHGERSIQLLTSPLVDHDSPTLDSAGQPLRYLAVYDSRLLELDDALQTLRRRQASGEDVRIAEDVPFSAIVVDGLQAVVDLTNIEPSGAGSVSLWDSPLITGIGNLVERLHASSLPLPAVDLDVDGELYSQRDQTILTLLAAGASDANVARQLGVSVRTVERRVRLVMERLGAQSRLQAGVEAVRRGLV